MSSMPVTVLDKLEILFLVNNLLCLLVKLVLTQKHTQYLVLSLTFPVLSYNVNQSDLRIIHSTKMLCVLVMT